MCTIPWWASLRSYKRIPNSLQLFRNVSTCCREIASAIGSDRSVVGMLWSGLQSSAPVALPCGPPTLAPRRPGRSHLVDQVQVDIENGLLTRLVLDNMLVPNLLEHRPRRGLARSCVGHRIRICVGFAVFLKASPQKLRRKTSLAESYRDLRDWSSFEDATFIVTYSSR